jgi:hypothetical protein
MTTATIDVDWGAALCAQTDPEAWFGDGSGARMQAARRVCRRCPLTGLDGPCLAAALSEPDMPHGIRAGLSQKRLQDLWLAARHGTEVPDTMCPHCGKDYTRLHQHIQLAHPKESTGQHRCHCGLAYTSRTGLAQHSRRMHGGARG